MKRDAASSSRRLFQFLSDQVIVLLDLSPFLVADGKYKSCRGQLLTALSGTQPRHEQADASVHSFAKALHHWLPTRLYS